jgi:hypothetical protein
VDRSGNRFVHSTDVKLHLAIVAAYVAACSADSGSGSAGSSETTGLSSSTDPSTTSPSTSDPDSSGAPDPTTDASSSEASTEAPTSGSSSTGATTGDTPSGNAGEWIIMHFADAPIVTGELEGRIYVETPALVLDASGTNAKYAFDAREEEEPVLAEIGFVNVSVIDLMSDDAFGAAISTAYAPGAIAYLDNVYVEPNWPAWVDYATTNYDGIVLDESAEFYAEDLTIVSWNADCAIDIKSPITQMVRLETMGGGNRTLRYWESGPHYLVESSVNNPDGTVLWFSDCGAVTLNVYDSTFNGEDTVPESAIECENGDTPNIVYLETDPRTTGEMHEMFSVG